MYITVISLSLFFYPSVSHTTQPFSIPPCLIPLNLFLSLRVSYLSTFFPFYPSLSSHPDHSVHPSSLSPFSYPLFYLKTLLPPFNFLTFLTPHVSTLNLKFSLSALSLQFSILIVNPQLSILNPQISNINSINILWLKQAEKLYGAKWWVLLVNSLTILRPFNGWFRGSIEEGR